MARPRLLDLFCGAGGAAMGYHRAGFDVTGIDIRPQPRYPFRFVQADAMTYPLDGFDVIHASPPCQEYSTGAPGRKRGGPDLLGPVRAHLIASGLPYVIENVATAPMPGSVLLCGATFDLPVIRHRRFEINPAPLLVPSTCPQSRYARGVAHRGRYGYGHGSWQVAWREHVLPVVWPWMTLAEAGQAIPPAYTEYIGGQLMSEFPAQEPAGRGSGGLECR
jgi:DNA (cytosine-5)-methyltransferase 1